MREIRESRRKKPYDGPLFTGLLIMLAILAGVTMILLVRSRPPQKIEGLAYEVDVVAGDIPGKPKAERQKELDSTMEERMLAMSIDTTPSGKDTRNDRSVDWSIESPSNQGKLIRMETYRDNTGEEIYEIGAIRPGSRVGPVLSNVGLPVREYDCAARFYTYRLETEEHTDRAAVKIRLMIYERKGQIWKKGGRSLEE